LKEIDFPGSEIRTYLGTGECLLRVALPVAS
jgi:hypothetical protein